ncbi:GumC family protein, partial [Roseovarius sp.]|uniref:GumC family protein n=1 Tax=Roseovarius sp. TaxID=1486281 RepID=UPI003565DB4F
CCGMQHPTLERLANTIMTTPSPPAADEAEIDLGQLARVVWRGKWWIILTAFIATMIGGYYAYSAATPVYTTAATVLQETNQDPVIDLSGGLGGAIGGGGDSQSINTEIEVMRSRGLLENLVDALGLIEDPEFNSTLRPPPTFSVSRLIALGREALGRTPPETLVLSAKEIEDREEAIKDRVVNAVRNALSISNIRSSFVYTIGITTEDPQKSAQIVNTLAALYIANQLDVKNEANVSATAWLADRVTELRIDLENTENAVQEFNANTDLINADTLAALNRQVKELRDRLANIRESRVSQQSRLAEIEAARQTQDPTLMAEAVDDRTLNQLLATLDGGADERERFDARFDQLATRTELEIQRLQNQITALERTVQEQESVISQQSADLLTLQQLEREAESALLLYEYFQTRLQETSLQSGILAADSRILSRAVVPQGPSAPRKPLILALSLVLGAMAGIALVLLREFRRSTFRASEELEEATGQSVLGEVPRIKVRRREKLLKYLADKPTSAAAEAVRNLRTSILFANPENPPQVIMSTSSVPGEGKTTQSLALAQNLAGMGKKVLLVEGDVRKRVFAEYFNIKDEHGLLAVIDGKTPIADAVTHEPSLKADVLMSEKPDRNAGDIFSAPAFAQFITEVRGIYDYIVIDTPPVLAVPDARIIGKLVDAVIYTVRWDHTTRRQVAQGIDAFRKAKIPVTGLVLSQVDPKGQKRYGYGDSVGSYGSYHEN